MLRIFIARRIYWLFSAMTPQIPRQSSSRRLTFSTTAMKKNRWWVSVSAIQLFRAHSDVDMTLPHNVRHNAYPAVLIGKFATHMNFSGKNFGRRVIEFLKLWFVTQNKTGCRYLIADSVPDATGFYEKCGFERFPVQRSPDTVLMFFDLKIYEIALRKEQRI
jgi:GNAT superfamily N-acetyltransferase